MEKIINQLGKQIIERFKGENTGHDINHLKRVQSISLKLQEEEGGDKLVIAISAFLHDIHRIIQKETGKFCSPKDSLHEIKKILDKVNIQNEKKERILHCIEYHEEYDFSEKGKTVNDIETLILQDADNLDAMGAIGIGRAFSFGGAHKIPMWTPNKSFHRENFDESEQDPSTIHHFYSKLLKLKNNMNTRTAKEIAEKRHDFMKHFLKEFFDEWKGEK